MAITNGYASLAEIKDAFDISDATDDALLELAVEAASRAIDDFCRRHFYKDGQDQTRHYSAEYTDVLFIDDLATVTSLKTDDDDSGTFETTWVNDTDFRLEPLNADNDGRPFTIVRAIDTKALPTTNRGVELIGRFGWPTVPTQVKQACLIQAERYFKRKDAPFGIAGATNDLGAMRLMAKVDPDVAVILTPLRRLLVR